MKAVINSSPVISLSLVKQLELLFKIYDEIFIPKSVYHEVVIEGTGKVGSDNLETISRFTVLEPDNKTLKDTIMLELDEGEADVIAIAKENNINYVIIDEFAGRQYASLLNLKVTGSLGILLVGKKLGLIKEIKPLMDIMINSNRYISQELYQAVLKYAEENIIKSGE